MNTKPTTENIRTPNDFKIPVKELDTSEYTARREQLLKTKTQSEPQLLYEYFWSTLFGLVEISLRVEDRRPDLDEVIGKYTHFIFFNFLWKEVSIVFRSTNGPGFYNVDKKTVHMDTFKN